MIRIDSKVTEMPKPIPWVKSLTIHAAVKIGKQLLRKKKPKMVCDMKHHYRWNHTFDMWMHTGMVHFKEVP